MIDKELKSITEIQTFRDKNPQLTPPHGGLIKFTAKVTYRRPGKKDITEITTVMTDPNGYNAWDIVLEQIGEINHTEVFVDFKPRFQEYKFSAEQNVLIITALNSSKGPYSVIIDPN